MKKARTAVVYDLDSTIAHTLHRHHLIPADHSNTDGWVEYSAACPGDTPVGGAAARVRLDYPHHQVHICSGRMSTALQETRDWLTEHDIPHDYLRLRDRDENENARNSDLKIAYIRQLLEDGIDVVLIYEDYPVIARSIHDATGVPVLGINPFYPVGTDRFGGV